jgi:hypothetical protein
LEEAPETPETFDNFTNKLIQMDIDIHKMNKTNQETGEKRNNPSSGKTGRKRRAVNDFSLEYNQRKELVLVLVIVELWQYIGLQNQLCFGGIVRNQVFKHYARKRLA